jgi:ribonuclease HI
LSKKVPKYYVVWVGHQPGVYSTWPQAQKQINGYPSAKYKSFLSKGDAEFAYKRDWKDYYDMTPKEPGRKKSEPLILTEELLKVIDANSIAVDAACSGNPGKMEYRGVYTLAPEKELFRSPVFPLGTNNIGEFLALVHGIALISEKHPDMTIYSDSRLAMGWIKAKKCRTKLPRNHKTEHLFTLIERGETWLKTHKFKNPIKKWETKKWGEIPADFGRK